MATDSVTATVTVPSARTQAGASITVVDPTRAGPCTDVEDFPVCADVPGGIYDLFLAQVNLDLDHWEDSSTRRADRTAFLSERPDLIGPPRARC